MFLKDFLEYLSRIQDAIEKIESGAAACSYKMLAADKLDLLLHELQKQKFYESGGLLGDGTAQDCLIITRCAILSGANCEGFRVSSVEALL